MVHRSSTALPAKPGLHPRNLHRAGYDFAALTATLPRLAASVRPSPVGSDTIDFADPAAVLTLNQALLKLHYGVAHWDLPSGCLCPPIPGRADYLHHLADLLGEPQGRIPTGPDVRILDIGVGANCIYPILGARIYGWSFVGSDLDRTALDWARGLVAANSALHGHVECRLQSSPRRIFNGVARPGETFAASICNPPFHASREEALAGTQRKLRALHGHRAAQQPTLNFGGRGNELWCEGGEAGFVRRMIAESAVQPRLCRWFTTLVAKRENLPAIERALKTAAPAEVRVIDMAQGQKKSRMVAWRF
jgi:23S rRNA (adenine1618-N6)-methyltransferase